ncbi:MAG: phosphoribosylaminoimidazolesuccinocarboxamide synthase [Actinobacteria bacterium]|nr:phosphoribosylaminoimidazolesuccinocarboxamide synthase [Actinomycetota bacterium]
MANTMFKSNIGGYLLVKRGKVRDIYSVGNKTHLMIIATDRISAFDCILPTPIPNKGIVLTQLSNFWFEKTKHIIPNHIDNPDPVQMDWYYDDDWYYDEVRGRVVLVKKAEPIPVECVVRGYLAGSGWKEYKEMQSICGVKLPKGLAESDKLTEPIFTPAMKEDVGHDINVTQEYIEKKIGKDLATKLKDISIALYNESSKYAEFRGIIIADTKFEFGFFDDELILIDEIFTPDSSRFWPKDGYEPGKPQPSYDKQFVRDYLETLNWDKTPPAPELPEEIVNKTSEKYLQAFKMITGKETLMGDSKDE